MKTNSDHVGSSDLTAESLAEANAKLAGALDMVRETLQGGNVQDLLFIINEALAAHRRADGGQSV